MTLEQLVLGIADFGTWKHADKIRLFIWFMHTTKGQEWVSAAGVGACFDKIHEVGPINVGPFLESLVKSGDAKRNRRNPLVIS